MVKRLPKVIYEDQALKLFSLTYNPHHRLQMQLMYYCGLRVSEMLALRVQDIDFKDSFLTVEDGKGDKAREVYIPKQLLTELKSYLAVYPKQDRLFTNTRRNVQFFVKRAGKRVGIEGLHPHTFRHGAGTRIYEKTGDIRAVKDSLGHESIATSDIYTHTAREQKRAVGRKVWE